MKIKINVDGYLAIDGMVKYCPYYYHYVKPCGDWCALFATIIGKDTFIVSLCRKDCFCDIKDFTDERKDTADKPEANDIGSEAYVKAKNEYIKSKLAEHEGEPPEYYKVLGEKP